MGGWQKSTSPNVEIVGGWLLVVRRNAYAEELPAVLDLADELAKLLNAT